MKAETRGALALAATIALLVTAGGAPAGSTAGSNTWAGTWSPATYGKMVLRANGPGKYAGTYESCNGAIEGTASGNKLAGTWTSRDWPQCGVGSQPGGTFEFTMAEDGKYFKGWWMYTKDTIHHPWYGQCAAGPCMQSGAVTPRGPIYLRLSQPGGSPFTLSLPVRWTYTAKRGGYVHHYFLHASNNATGQTNVLPRGYYLWMEYRTAGGVWKHYFSAATNISPWHFGYSCPPETKIWRAVLYHSTNPGQALVAVSNTVRVTCKFVKK